jgi:hypothetical protein
MIGQGLILRTEVHPRPRFQSPSTTLRGQHRDPENNPHPHPHLHDLVVQFLANWQHRGGCSDLQAIPKGELKKLVGA